MKPLLLREVLTGLVLVVGFFLYVRWDAKRDGEVSLKLAQNESHVAVLDSALKVERGKFSVDTVKVFRRMTKVDSIFNEIVKSDTLRLTDTVQVTVEVIRESVATLNACRETVRSCGELRALEQRRGDSLNVRVGLLEKERPSMFGNLARAALYLSAGIGIGAILK